MSRAAADSVIEFMAFQCDSNEDACEYLRCNDYWTRKLMQYPGFVSTWTMISEDLNGRVYVIIKWRSLDDWAAVPKADLMEYGKEFDRLYGKHYETVSKMCLESRKQLRCVCQTELH